MGHRTVKRVAMDFEWPMHKVWKGYINPYSKLAVKCLPCDGSGSSPDAKFLNDTWYQHLCEGMWGPWFGSNIKAVPDSDRIRKMGWPETVVQNVELARKFGFKVLAHWSDKLDERDIAALAKAGRLTEFTHKWNGKKWVKKKSKKLPTPDEVNSGYMHDSINSWVCIKARCRRLHVSSLCSTCEGHGEFLSSDNRKLRDNWKEEEPPTGAGWQLWETCSEGSPVSPVFETAEALAEWCEGNATIFASEKMPRSKWLELFKDSGKLEVGSLMVMHDGYIGSAAQSPDTILDNKNEG